MTDSNFDAKRWIETGGRTMYAIKQDGKTIQRSFYVDDLFWACVGLVRKGVEGSRLEIVDELSNDEVITDDVASFMVDVGAIRSSEGDPTE